MNKNCNNCRYRELYGYQEPCNSCSTLEFNKWKPKKEEIGRAILRIREEMKRKGEK